MPSGGTTGRDLRKKFPFSGTSLFRTGRTRENNLSDKDLETWVKPMKKVATFRCQDLGLPCDYEMQAEGEMELMKRIEGHVRTVHEMDVTKEETREKILRILEYR
jgi:predicted small metal-binding protein